MSDDEFFHIECRIHFGNEHTAGPLTMQDVNLQSVDSVKSCEKPDFELCIERELSVYLDISSIIFSRL